MLKKFLKEYGDVRTNSMRVKLGFDDYIDKDIKIYSYTFNDITLRYNELYDYIFIYHLFMPSVSIKVNDYLDIINSNSIEHALSTRLKDNLMSEFANLKKELQPVLMKMKLEEKLEIKEKKKKVKI